MLKLLLPLGILAFLYKKGAGAKQLQYEVVGVQVYRFTLPATVELRISVRFLNASSQQFNVNSLRLNIGQGGTLLGDCYVNQPLMIAAGAQPTFTFPVNVRGVAVLNKLVPLLLANKPLPALDVAGFISIEGVETALDNIQVPLAPYDPRRTVAPQKATPAPNKATPVPKKTTPAAKKAVPARKKPTTAPRR